MRKNVTIYTLAKELNMTPSSISRAFNPNASISEKKRELILETAKKYNFTPNQMASRLPMKEIQIGVLLYMRFKPCYSELMRGIYAAHDALKNYKVNCDLQFLDKNEHSADDCRKVLEKFVDYDGIIISGLNKETGGAVISEIYSENKNIVLLNTYCAEKEKLFLSTVDVKAAARLAAEFLKNALMFSPRKNVVLFCGDQELGTHRISRKAFIETCAEYGLNIYKIYEMKDNSEVLKRICQEEFSKIAKDTDGVYITSGNSTELCRYIQDNGLSDKLALVTFDVYPELNEYVKKGVINATIYQNHFEQARSAYENLAYHIIENRKVPEVLNTKIELVLKNNIHLYE